MDKYVADSRILRLTARDKIANDTWTDKPTNRRTLGNFMSQALYRTTRRGIFESSNYERLSKPVPFRSTYNMKKEVKRS